MRRGLQTALPLAVLALAVPLPAAADQARPAPRLDRVKLEARLAPAERAGDLSFYRLDVKVPAGTAKGTRAMIAGPDGARWEVFPRDCEAVARILGCSLGEVNGTASLRLGARLPEGREVTAVVRAANADSAFSRVKIEARPAAAKVKPDAEKSGPVKSGPVKSGPVKSGPVKSGPVKSEPAKAEPAKTRPQSGPVPEKAVRPPVKAGVLAPKPEAAGPGVVKPQVKPAAPKPEAAKPGTLPVPTPTPQPSAGPKPAAEPGAVKPGAQKKAKAKVKVKKNKRPRPVTTVTQTVIAPPPRLSLPVKPPAAQLPPLPSVAALPLPQVPPRPVQPGERLAPPAKGQAGPPSEIALAHASLRPEEDGQLGLLAVIGGALAAQTLLLWLAAMLGPWRRRPAAAGGYALPNPMRALRRTKERSGDESDG